MLPTYHTHHNTGLVTWLPLSVSVSQPGRVNMRIVKKARKDTQNGSLQRPLRGRRISDAPILGTTPLIGWRRRV